MKKETFNDLALMINHALNIKCNLEDIKKIVSKQAENPLITKEALPIVEEIEIDIERYDRLIQVTGFFFELTCNLHGLNPRTVYMENVQKYFDRMSKDPKIHKVVFAPTDGDD